MYRLHKHAPPNYASFDNLPHLRHGRVDKFKYAYACVSGSCLRCPDEIMVLNRQSAPKESSPDVGRNLPRRQPQTGPPFDCAGVSPLTATKRLPSSSLETRIHKFLCFGKPAELLYRELNALAANRRKGVKAHCSSDPVGVRLYCCLSCFDTLREIRLRRSFTQSSVSDAFAFAAILVALGLVVVFF